MKLVSYKIVVKLDVSIPAPSSSANFPSSCGIYLTSSAFQVVLQESIPTQIHQLDIHISNSKESVDGFVGDLTSAKTLEKHIVGDKTAGRNTRTSNPPTLSPNP